MSEDYLNSPGFIEKVTEMTKLRMLRESPESYHVKCGSYGATFEIGSSKWEVCNRCGEVIREVRP